MPLPWDRDAEERTISLRLWGYAVAADLQPLSRCHLYAAEHQALWSACDAIEQRGDVVTPEGVRDEFERAGGIGPIRPHIEQIYYAPMVTGRELRAAIARIIELAERRQLIMHAERVALRLRSGELCAADGVRALRDGTAT
jgi:hypothetical protein